MIDAKDIYLATAVEIGRQWGNEVRNSGARRWTQVLNCFSRELALWASATHTSPNPLPEPTVRPLGVRLDQMHAQRGASFAGPGAPLLYFNACGGAGEGGFIRNHED